MCAFILSGWDSGSTAAKGTPKMGRYKQLADSIATISAAAYFDSTIVAEQASVGDAIYIVGSDGAQFQRVSVVTSPTDITLADMTA